MHAKSKSNDEKKGGHNKHDLSVRNAGEKDARERCERWDGGGLAEWYRVYFQKELLRSIRLHSAS